MSGISRDAYSRVEGLNWGADIFNSFLEIAGSSLNKLAQLISSLFFGECENDIKANCKDSAPLNATRIVESLTVAAVESENDVSPKSTPSTMDIVPDQISARTLQVPKNKGKSFKEPMEMRNPEPVVVRVTQAIPNRGRGKNRTLMRNQSRPPSADQLKEDITKLKTELSAVKSEYSSAVQSYQVDFKQFEDRGNYHYYPIDALSSKIGALTTQLESKEHVFKELYPKEYQAFLGGESDEEIFPMDLG
jgi:hypothetical protein